MRTNSRWSVQTLVGHSGMVRCLHLAGNRLVSGSADATIKVCNEIETASNFKHFLHISVSECHVLNNICEYILHEYCHLRVSSFSFLFSVYFLV